MEHRAIPLENNKTYVYTGKGSGRGLPAVTGVDT